MGEQNERLERLISRLERHQQALDLSDTAFCAKYIEHVGSAKTWRDRLIARQFAELDLDKWTKRLQQLVSRLDGGSLEVEAFFESMPFARQMGSLVGLLQGQTNDRRNVYALATTGVGKSIFARQYALKNPQSCVYVRMHEHCRNHESHICHRLTQALGCKSEVSAGASLQILIDFLQANPLLIFIDEAHSGGHKLMQLVKTLIDETPARFVQLAYPTEFDRVRTATAGALDEAKQLIGRTIKPIFDDYREGLKIPDIVCYLTNSGLGPEDARDVAAKILPLVRQNGNLRVLADAVTDARLIAEQHAKPLDAVMIRQAVEAQCPRRRTGGEAKEGA